MGHHMPPRTTQQSHSAAPRRGTMALLGCPRGHMVAHETECLTRPGYSPSNPSAQNQSTVADMTPEWSFGSVRSSCLWLQIFGVERFSFLPNMQSDGRDLTRQGQPGQLGLHPLPQKVFVEPAKGSVTATGGGRRALEQVLQIVVVVQVQSTNEHRLFPALQLAIHHAIVGAAARFQRQAAVGPELPLTAETMGASAPGRSARRRVSDRATEWCAATWLRCACDTRQSDPGGLRGAAAVADRVPGRVAGRGAAARSRLTAPTTLRDAVIHRASCRHRQWPGCGRALSTGP